MLFYFITPKDWKFKKIQVFHEVWFLLHIHVLKGLFTALVDCLWTSITTEYSNHTSATDAVDRDCLKNIGVSLLRFFILIPRAGKSFHIDICLLSNGNLQQNTWGWAVIGNKSPGWIPIRKYLSAQRSLLACVTPLQNHVLIFNAHVCSLFKIMLKCHTVIYYVTWRNKVQFLLFGFVHFYKNE